MYHLSLFFSYVIIKINLLEQQYFLQAMSKPVVYLSFFLKK